MKIRLIFVIVIILIVSLNADLAQLKPLQLDNQSGGYADGSIWKSDFLIGNTNVIFYVDPDKRADVKNLISALEVRKEQNDDFTITYIVNTKATMKPTFLIKKMIKKMAEKSKTISYVLDYQKVLVKHWNLVDDCANVLILNDENQILHQFSGKINDAQIDEISKIIKKKFSKKEKK